ncbi:hypothetical protein AB1462_31435, partial [Pseudomonas sp. SB113]
MEQAFTSKRGLAGVSIIALLAASGYALGQSITATGDINPAFPSPTSQWNVGSLSIGTIGTGVLTIDAGGTVTSTDGDIGIHDGSNGIVTVSGANARWQNTGGLWVGEFDGSNGTLTIGAGGTVTNREAYIGLYDGSSGTVTVSGANARWQNSGNLFV